MIVRTYVSFFAFCFLSVLTACGANNTSDSRLDGHYEDSSAGDMEPFAGRQTAIPEYRESRGVIISLPLLAEYGKAQMAADILASGVQTLWVTVPADYSGTVESADFALLRNLVGPEIRRVKLVKQRESGPVTVWARDWSPLGAKTADGSLHLLDFNYYPERAADDGTARSMFEILPVERISVPVYNEGGNFMNNDRGDCMMSSRVTDANAERFFPDDMILDEAQIKGYYQSFAGCKTVTIFPRIPYEGTGHIDMWAKFLDDDTVIVSELRNEIVQLSGYTATQRRKVQNMQTYLERRAAEIKAMGYEVIRLPMPAPAFAPDGDTFRSYTNSLTVNGDALVPRYQTPAFAGIGVNGRYLDDAYIAGYEREVRQVYEAQGYRFKWVVSDDLIAYGGAVHCTTMQIAL
jgi:agmatine/peptidylarginine deiminase